MSFQIEVHAYGDPAGAYTSNGVRFKTKGEAETYGDDLAYRWTGVADWRIAESIEAPTFRLVIYGQLIGRSPTLVKLESPL